MARSIWQSHEMRHVLTADACLSRTMHTMSCCSRCGGRARQCRGPCHIRPMASMQCDARACADRFGLPRSGIKQLSCRADRAAGRAPLCRLRHAGVRAHATLGAVGVPTAHHALDTPFGAAMRRLQTPVQAWGDAARHGTAHTPCPARRSM